MSLPEITIIGTGGLGQALARALSAKKVSILSIFNRTQEKANRIAQGFDIPIKASFPSNIDQLGNIIFLTVSDQAIADRATQLSLLTDNFSGKVIAHCSGNESAQLLRPLQTKGAKVASFHPLQTFTNKSGVQDFEGIYFSLQGDESAFPCLKKVAQKLNAQTLELSKDQKSHLHVAAVIASNYLNTLLDAAVSTASLSGLAEDQAKEALLPLIKTTLKNIEHHSPEDALTGPVKRGDIKTVKNHLDILQDQPELARIYCQLGKRTVALASKYRTIDSSTAQKLLNLLE